MSDPATQLHKATGITRRSRLARFTGATAVAGAIAAGLMAGVAPAGADTVLNPHCPVPTSVVFQRTSLAFIPVPVTGALHLQGLFTSQWQATYNGVHYVGVSHGYGGPPAAPNLTTAGSCEPG